MRRAVAAELLRAVSGFSFIAAALYFFLIPFFVLTQTSGFDGLSGVSSVEASHAFFRPAGSISIATASIAASSVTREFYYESIDRSLILNGKRQLLLAKVAATAIVGAGMSLFLLAAWSAIGLIWLRNPGLSLVFDEVTLEVGLGMVSASLPAVAFGCLLA
ncbi:hypothetical protein JD292_10245 [Leucobacter sp. CSA2]|uniref:Uncharacterized protein n=1 Tax=Leucobacter edaphi TaxID=2796472 RepID=A0A934UY66_9MICO|nr:hypothetical protein [Leucobacter edaphi]MBK0422451.1 hypothetical protein [Leucobacter edaphi]